MHAYLNTGQLHRPNTGLAGCLVIPGCPLGRWSRRLDASCAWRTCQNNTQDRRLCVQLPCRAEAGHRDRTDCRACMAEQSLWQKAIANGYGRTACQKWQTLRKACQVVKHNSTGLALILGHTPPGSHSSRVHLCHFLTSATALKGQLCEAGAGWGWAARSWAAGACNAGPGRRRSGPASRGSTRSRGSGS